MNEIQKKIKKEYESFNLQWHVGRVINIEENDIKLIVFNNEIDSMICPICKGQLSWELEGDSETPHYFSVCCNKEFQLWPKEWVLEITDEGE